MNAAAYYVLCIYIRKVKWIFLIGFVNTVYVYANEYNLLLQGYPIKPLYIYPPLAHCADSKDIEGKCNLK